MIIDWSTVMHKKFNSFEGVGLKKLFHKHAVIKSVANRPWCVIYGLTLPGTLIENLWSILPPFQNKYHFKNIFFSQYMSFWTFNATFNIFFQYCPYCLLNPFLNKCRLRFYTWNKNTFNMSRFDIDLTVIPILLRYLMS